MSVEVWVLMAAGIAALVVGLVFVRARFRAAGAGKVLVLGPVFEAVALAIFSAEHFAAARLLSGIVPRWLPGPLFWTYFFGVALALAAISFVVWRGVRWSSVALVMFFWIIVLTVDLPGLPKGMHDRFFWILTVRETCFGAGALVLAGSVWGRPALVRVGRVIVGAVMVFYALEHFLHPRNVPGVPLQKMTPGWIPGAVGIASFVGVVLLVCGVWILVGRRVRLAAAFAGAMLVLLVLLFYVPIAVTEMHTPLAVEGLNYVGDTLLFGATVLLAGWGAESEQVPGKVADIRP
ncbi:MAG TPA: hypothetical protein VFA99_13440 [Acidobacteriaceae bacterium]|nr:hypothetical protein [Acidobacteriaceae bacterium]